MTQSQGLNPARSGDGRRILLAVLIVSLNLRGAITCVGPLLKEIQDTFALSSAAAGLLSSLPLFAFAIISPYAAPLSRRIGMEYAIMLSLLLLLAGLGIRYCSTPLSLYGGTVLIGAGIAISNVLLPGLLRREFPQQLPMVTALFTMVLVTVGGLGSGIAIPLATLGGWDFSLVFWVLPAVFGLLAWLPRLKHNTRQTKPDSTVRINLWKSGLAWQVSLFMACQSTAFYVMIAWLPSMLSDLEGISAAQSGWILFIYQIFVLLSVMAIPLLVHRLPDQRWIGASCALLILLAYCGITWSTANAIWWMILMGLGAGGSLVLAMTLFSLRVSSAMQTVALSGMAQAVGYTMAALMPILIGYIYDLTHSWQIPLLLMIGICALQTVTGYLAGRPLVVEPELAPSA